MASALAEPSPLEVAHPDDESTERTLLRVSLRGEVD
jgi:hypothetical protein